MISIFIVLAHEPLRRCQHIPDAGTLLPSELLNVGKLVWESFFAFISSIFPG